MSPLGWAALGVLIGTFLQGLGRVTRQMFFGLLGRSASVDEEQRKVAEGQNPTSGDVLALLEDAHNLLAEWCGLYPQMADEEDQRVMDALLDEINRLKSVNPGV